MKLATITAILIATITLTVPVVAQDRDQGKDQAHVSHDVSVRHRVSHQHEKYQRNYKTDEEEHQATEDLNKQYRGVPRSEVH